jgi:isopentenyl-diphosphate delta-isomerase
MKYHSGGLWTNTCCGHPLPGEAVNESAMRRLQEEMGFECLLLPAFLFTYKAELDQGLIEYEYDHVLIGYHNMPPIPDPDEVSEWKYEALTVIKEQLDVEPTVFTPWFRIAFPKVLNYLAEKNTEMQINR